jgi:phosphoribosyl 1,2-cyclic phosphodiesterase
MALQYASLNSGSNGNCYYVGNAQEGVLIDAGLSCRETEKRMKQLGISLKKIKGIFISHEHIDHVKGIEVISKKHNIPIYINRATRNHCRLPIPEPHTVFISNSDVVQIGELEITAFSKKHDAADPISFVIKHQDVRIGVFTDIGSVCENLQLHFSSCHVVFLEANYEEEMLENGPYPFLLKQRIRGENGHLSNDQAINLIQLHRSPQLSHILLSHLSKENNCPNLAQQKFQQAFSPIHVEVASRYHPSQLHTYSASPKIKTAPENLMQLNLFDPS